MESLDSLKSKIINELDSKKYPNQFIVKSANKWIEESKSRPKPNRLFGDFWFENEVCILFADTNQGKSILATQIGESIASGRNTCGLDKEVLAQKILYFDFELSDKQFENRYSNDYSNHYNFPSNFIRAEINDECLTDNLVDFEKQFLNSIEHQVLYNNIKIIFIDNLTYLKNETEKAKDALSLMKELKVLKNKHNLSILILAHTPKRDASKPLTKNDLSGSKMLINFCDSCFAIGESSSDNGVKYLKQIKQRNTEQKYGSDNIILFQIEKYNSFLQFSFIGFSTEIEHLKTLDIQDRNDRNDTIVKLHNEGLSNVDIAKEVGVSEGTVRYVIKNNN